MDTQMDGCYQVHHFPSTLFSERSAHENHPIFLRSLGHRHQRRVILKFMQRVQNTATIVPKLQHIYIDPYEI